MDVSQLLNGLTLAAICGQVALTFRIWKQLATMEERLRAHEEQLQRHERWMERRERARPI